MMMMMKERGLDCTVRVGLPIGIKTTNSQTVVVGKWVAGVYPQTEARLYKLLSCVYSAVLLWELTEEQLSLLLLWKWESRAVLYILPMTDDCLSTNLADFYCIHMLSNSLHMESSFIDTFFPTGVLPMCSSIFVSSAALCLMHSTFSFVSSAACLPLNVSSPQRITCWEESCFGLRQWLVNRRTYV